MGYSSGNPSEHCYRHDPRFRKALRMLWRRWRKNTEYRRRCGRRCAVRRNVLRLVDVLSKPWLFPDRAMARAEWLARAFGSRVAISTCRAVLKRIGYRTVLCGFQHEAIEDSGIG